YAGGSLRCRHRSLARECEVPTAHPWRFTEKVTYLFGSLAGQVAHNLRPRFKINLIEVCDTG
ncbi:MAG: hypothetical protein ACUVQG_14475, partial [Thermogutta sp.]